MSKTPKPKKRGRPTVLGKEAVYTAIRLPALLSKAIDKWAEVMGVGRSEAVRQLIEAGLKRRPKA
jgi:metal-responsive CopG/Arc/MetJ family transcriptional regulator